MMKDNNFQIISAMSQWRIQTRQYIHILTSRKKNFIVMLLFPLLAALITIWLAGKDMFINYEGTKSGCFVIVSATIWGGLFNTIQSVVQERANIKREYINGLRIRCYTASRVMVQFVLCIIQSLILCLTFEGVKQIYGNDIPTEGIIIKYTMLEYYISILLLMFAADMMGFFISCVVKKSETANVLAPYILIVQLIFSGILFSMKGYAEKISYLMISRWGMEALGSISDLNNIQLRIQESIPNVPHEVETMYERSDQHIVTIWIGLVLFTIMFIFIGNLFLHSVSKDKR